MSYCTILGRHFFLGTTRGIVKILVYLNSRSSFIIRHELTIELLWDAIMHYDVFTFPSILSLTIFVIMLYT